MEVDMRYMRTKDLRSFLQAHHDAVRGIAAKDYPPAVIEQWAPLPITEKHVERVRANPETEIRLLAEINDEIVGLGAIVLAKNELHACYAMPSAARKGVGSALVRELERIALEHGSNWTPHRHPNRSIWPSACVKMQKNLIPPTGVR